MYAIESPFGEKAGESAFGVESVNWLTAIGLARTFAKKICTESSAAVASNASVRASRLHSVPVIGSGLRKTSTGPPPATWSSSIRTYRLGCAVDGGSTYAYLPGKGWATAMSVPKPAAAGVPETGPVCTSAPL